ncbi:hypothetical protein Tco_1340103 [Tanacetum coccineum]
MSKVLHERGFGSLPSSTETNLRDHVKSFSTIVEVDASLICRIGSHQYNVSTEQNSEVIEEFRARNDVRMVSKSFGYPSDCDHDKKIRIDCAYNLKFSCMIDFAVLEDMDAYRDEGMGDVIFWRTIFERRPRCKEIDDVGKVSKIWKSGSVGVLKS